MNRRDFLKIAGIGAGASMLKPPADIEWPEGVKIKFDVDRGRYYALTIDDGWSGANIEPFVVYAIDNNLVPFTWFANGVGVRRIAESEKTMEIIRSNWCIEVGYHTMHHPAVDDQRRNYDRRRWIEDYEEWLEIAKTTFAEFPHLIKPFARAAGGYFSDPFMEMCEEKGLMPYGWSKDPYVTSRGAVLEPGDIFLTHFRYSEWRWFNWLAEQRAAMMPMCISSISIVEKWMCPYDPAGK